MKKILFILAIAIAAYSCIDRDVVYDDDYVCDYTDRSDEPYCGVENIKLFVEAIKSGNMDATLAEKLINPNNPMSFDYPMRPIFDGEDLIKYLPLLVDDSIKNILIANGEKWVDDDWRGCYFNIGEIWFDERGYLADIMPFSDTFYDLHNALVDCEFATLHPSVKEKIQFPRLVFTIPSNGWIGRIDRIESDKHFPFEDGAEVVGYHNVDQLSIYKRGTPLTAKPDYIVEGESYISNFFFEDSYRFRTDSICIEFDNPTYDNPKGAKIYVKYGGKEASNYDYDKVVSAELIYWMDEFNK